MEINIAMHHRIAFIHKGGKTKRYHTEDTLTEQTVADHSFGVAMLVLLMQPRVRKEVLLAALVHDLAEHQVGDVSAPVKRANPELKANLDAMEHRLLAEQGLNFADNLTESELILLKAADCMDGMLFCVRERRMGGDVRHIYQNYKSYVKQLDGKLPVDAFYVMQSIQQLWSEANER